MNKTRELEIDNDIVDEIADEILEEGGTSKKMEKFADKTARPNKTSEVEISEGDSSVIASRLDELENRIDDLHEVIMKLNNEIKRLKETTSVQKYVKANLE